MHTNVHSQVLHKASFHYCGGRSFVRIGPDFRDNRSLYSDDQGYDNGPGNKIGALLSLTDTARRTASSTARLEPTSPGDGKASGSMSLEVTSDDVINLLDPSPQPRVTGPHRYGEGDDYDDDDDDDDNDHDAVMLDVDASDGTELTASDSPRPKPRPPQAAVSGVRGHRPSSYERRQEFAATSPNSNAAVDKLSKIRLVDASDVEQVHSPHSSAASQWKRTRRSSPTHDAKAAFARGLAKSTAKYVAKGAPVVLAKSRLKTVSGLRASGARPLRRPLPARSTTYPSKFDQDPQQPADAFAQSFADPNSCTAESDFSPQHQTQDGPIQLSWDPQVRAPAYASVNTPQLMPSGIGLAGTLPRYKMTLQPKSSPLTQQQLGAEVKGIYAGLVMVEAKCINMDNARAADPQAEVSKEEWQTLIALHRTLLYEHHDFLMATQHPSANPALRGLASKYCMPARMWKHGIHAFLEVLRHRRPDSQEYMLTFIYLAYQMMCLLFDTIPSYLDTWIECLGDLARYRMAIEEDKEIHAVWCSVAARWYQMAADRHPRIGRLYHHLGILERPSLRKLYYYARSLTSVVPFVNAAESLATLCAPILQDDKALRCGNHSAEAMTICVHARVFTTSQKGSPSPEDLELIVRDCTDAHNLLKEQTSGKIASYGVALAVTNIAALFQYGIQQNVFRVMYTEALARDAHNARPTVQAQDGAKGSGQLSGIDASVVQDTTAPLDAVVTFWSSCFNSLIDTELNQATLRDLMQYVHVNLVWISSLINLRDRLKNTAHLKIVNSLFQKLDWPKLARFLNAISQIDPITQRVEEHAIHNIFLMPDLLPERRPLVEDYMLRGLPWAENYPSPELFLGSEDDDGSRLIETPARLHLRAERVLWLACLVAQDVKKSGLSYDRSTQRFSARTPLGIDGDDVGAKQGISNETTGERSPQSTEAWPARTSSPSSTTDDFEMVSMPRDAGSSSPMEESRVIGSKSHMSTAAINGSQGRRTGKQTESVVMVAGDEDMFREPAIY